MPRHHPFTCRSLRCRQSCSGSRSRNCRRSSHHDHHVHEPCRCLRGGHHRKCKGLAVAAFKRTVTKQPVKLLAKELSKLIPGLGQIVAPAVSIGMIESTGWTLAQEMERKASAGFLSCIWSFQRFIVHCQNRKEVIYMFICRKPWWLQFLEIIVSRWAGSFFHLLKCTPKVCQLLGCTLFCSSH